MNPQEDLQQRWLPSSEQMKLADAVLSAGYTADRDRGERGVYTAHLLVNKEYGFWTTNVELVFLDGVFLTRDAVLEFVHAAAEKHHRETGLKLVGGWAWHIRPGEAAVWDDIMSQFPDPHTEPAKPQSFLVVEDDLTVAFKKVFDRAAGVKFLTDTIDDPERFSAFYCELFSDGTTWAEKVNSDHIEWLNPSTCIRCNAPLTLVDDVWVGEDGTRHCPDSPGVFHVSDT